MCDYSIANAKTRDAKVGDKLVTTGFGMGTSGFASIDDCMTAVCLLPGTELAFDAPVEVAAKHLWDSSEPARTIEQKTARFRQIDKDNAFVHHDACEFGDGDFVLLTRLALGQKATVLQLPAKPQTAVEAKEQERLPIAA